MSEPIEAPGDGRRKHAPGLPRAQSLTRAAALVRAVGAGAASSADPTTAVLARECALPVATAARLLATLSDEGFVERSPDGAGWTLGLPLVRLARAADPDRALLAAAPPLLAELAAEAGESAALAVARPGPVMDVIAQADAPDGLLGAGRWVGRAFPLHASGPGKLILAGLDAAELREWVRRTRPERFTRRTITSARGLQAELDRVRRQGYAELDDELEPALASLAVPVPGPDGAPVAYLGVSGPSSRLDARRRRALIAPARTIAERLGRAVAGDRRTP
jgi:DNA-binding IclR family transcriptional regulator